MIKLSLKPPVDIEPLFEISQGLEKALLLFSAMEYGIFTRLKEKPKSAEELARELGTSLHLTAKFLNSLVAIGLLAKKDSLFANTPISTAYLVKNEPFFQGNLLNLMKKARGERWQGLSRALKTGTPQEEKKFEAVFDKSFIQAMAEGAMRGGLSDTLERISSLPEFANATRLLDLGGGHGLYAIAFVQENPRLSAFVFDLPPVVEVAEEFIARYGMKERIQTIAGDFTREGWGNNYDIIFASDALYRKKDLLLPILEKIKTSLNRGGVFISKQWTIDKERTTPTTTVLWDLMVSLKGSFPFQTYTNEEFINLLKEAGFGGIELFDISSPSKPSRIIVGRKER